MLASPSTELETEVSKATGSAGELETEQFEATARTVEVLSYSPNVVSETSVLETPSLASESAEVLKDVLDGLDDFASVVNMNKKQI